MRILRMIGVAALTVPALTGCGLFEDSEQERLQHLLDQNAAVVVMLTDDATQQQKTDIEARLRAVPDVTDVVFEDSQATYDRFKKGLNDDKALDGFTAENFPEDFRAKMPDQEAVRRFRDSAAKGDIGALAGVSEVVIPCTTVAECQASRNELTSKSPG